MTGYKTLLVAVAIAIVGALQGLDWVHLLPTGAPSVGWLTTGLGVLMFGLRTITTTPIASSK